MIKKISIPIFYGTLVLFQDYDIEKACKELSIKEDNINAFDAITGCDTDSEGHVGYGIIFRKCTAPIIAHEAVHVAHNIIEMHGMSNDGELVAYLTGWVTLQCHKYLKVS